MLADRPPQKNLKCPPLSVALITDRAVAAVDADDPFDCEDSPAPAIQDFEWRDHRAASGRRAVLWSALEAFDAALEIRQPLVRLFLVGGVVDLLSFFARFFQYKLL